MGKLQDGTYMREPDGAWHLYHSETEWNDAVFGLRRFLDNPGAFKSGSLWYWRKVEDQAERDAVRNYLNSELLPGEWVVVRFDDTKSYEEENDDSR